MMRKLIVLVIISISYLAFNQAPWVAPDSAAKVPNPIPADAASIKSGEKIFQALCWTCHGKSGKGDGPVSVNLNPKPGNLSTKTFHVQTDGAIFWKITEGRGEMTSYKANLTTKQRWQLVNYLRTLKQ